ncbi:MAG: STN and carboxypeptidase regulatory-like domain-containing protein [Bacteroidales bacterium]
MTVAKPSLYNGRTIVLATLLAILAFTQEGVAQEGILDEPVTIRLNNARISAILKQITRKTGYYFTYDADLINTDSVISLNTQNLNLREILDTILQNDIFRYTPIGNHIVIYRDPDITSDMIREEGRKPVYQISGLVSDKESGEPLPYATLGIYKKGKGTVSNAAGRFSFKVTYEDLTDSLRISHIGFRNMIIPVRALIGTNYLIELERDYIPIPEIIIRTRDPVDLIRNIIENIPENYGTSPAMLTAFYRESVTRKSKLQEYSEAVINIFKSSYSNPGQRDQVKLFKSRKMLNIDTRDTLLVKLRAGLDASLTLDGAKNPFDFIREESLQDYDFRITDIVSLDDEAAYVVEFSQKEHITEEALYEGYIYINTTNYGMYSAEFRINPDYIHKLDNRFVPHTSRGYVVKARSVKYRTDYRYINGRYYLNHVRGDLEFAARKKRTLFSTQYNIFFELATTNIDTTSVSRFNRNEQISTTSVFSETIRGYDPEFWGTDNFIAPEEDIREAINRINARLSRFELE